MKYLIILFSCILISQNCKAQENFFTKKTNKKNSFYAFWGWNRAQFSNSDIHFSGEDYDFTIMDVQATDRPSAFDFKTYFHPRYLSIPQYNFKVGYYFTDKYHISIGTDHMKYVMKNYQKVQIQGYILSNNNPYNGYYDSDSIALSPDFLIFEHTDGLNYAHAELRRTDYLLQKKLFKLGITGGVGFGILYPRTNTTLLSKEKYDQFHYSGIGASVMLGVHIEFLKYFFIEPELKFGMINMPNIRTTKSSADKAEQKFRFSQFNTVFGVHLYPFK